MNDKTLIMIEASVNAPIEKVWSCWTEPSDIPQWNNASEDWHTTRAENNLVAGGSFSSRMESKDGTQGFDFGGTYDEVVPMKRIAYTLGDSRKVEILFQQNGDRVHVTETFEAEATNSIEMQKGGWQSILDNFKKYVEAK